MIQKSISILHFCLIIVITSTGWSQSYSGGSGTSSDPYRISTVQDLITLSRTESHWSSSPRDYNNIYKYFIQTADIVFNSNPQLVDWNNDGQANWSVEDQKGFNPIGRGAYGAPREFMGSYDGGNYNITNLYINLTATAPASSEPHDVGMFGYIFSPGILKNIHLKNANVSSLRYNIGALAGYIISAIDYYPTVNNCSSSGTVNGNVNAGGLVGYSHTSNILNSYSSCNVTTTGDGAGGIVGGMNYNFASLKNCFSTGTVTGRYNVGGLVGTLSSYSGKTSELSNCYSTSNVNGYDNVGGLVGYLGQDTNVFNSYSTGAVLATNVNPKKGGLIGNFSPYDPNITITNCFWDTENSGLSTSYGTGAVGKTTAQMKTQATYSSWNFAAGVSNWSIQSSSAYISYPYLQRFTYDTPGALQSVNPIPGLLNLNQAPTDISLSATSINENVAANSTIGALTSTDSDAGNTFTYTLVSGSGATDNASFTIVGANLRMNLSPDYETKNSYSARIRTTDQAGAFFEKAFTITVNDLNEAPSDSSLSTTSINENVAANSTVGSLISTDSDAGNTFTYTLVSGSGATDNDSFTVVGANLRMNLSPDYETKNSYSVRIRTTDQGSLSFEKAFTITVNDINETPTDISLSATSINENVAASTTVGSFTSTDSDAGNTFTYTLVSGSGATDNASFTIVGANLRMNLSPDYETKSSYSARIRTTDQGGLSFEKMFTIVINNVDESPILSLPQSNYSGVINVSFPTISVTNSGGTALSYTITPNLPTGMFFNANTGAMSGRPSVAITNTNYLISGSNSDGNGSVVFTLFIDIDTDVDGIGNNTDPDIDGDGISNASDSDINGDGTLDNGTDTDSDGINDANDTDIDGDEISNTSDSDINGDGSLDNGTDTDSDGINDANDTDIDGDGISNASDSDINGDGTLDNGADTDSDGINDANDADVDGDGISNTSDSDINGDGTLDNGTDTDSDGINDANDTDIDGDGISNASDSDINGDGTLDNGADNDNDGVNNSSDSDVNGDGIVDNGTDTDSDGINDANDIDIDGDGVPNTYEVIEGTNPNIYGAKDTDGDGVPDYIEILERTNVNNTSNFKDTDNDGISDYKEGYNYFNLGDSTDTDLDTIPNYLDSDSDSDSILDVNDAFPLNRLEWTDSDRDGTGNNTDTDDDNDGILDIYDADINGDGIPDNGIDMDRDGIIDSFDTDKDGDGVNNTSDNCPDVTNANQADRDHDGQGDVCDTIELNISEAITPNGDGINDRWVIYNIENHPNSTVRVFNSNGVQVYYSANYQNDWSGNYQGSSEMLPSGSYLYQVDLGGDGTIDEQGWLYITK